MPLAAVCHTLFRLCRQHFHIGYSLANKVMKPKKSSFNEPSMLQRRIHESYFRIAKIGCICAECYYRGRDDDEHGKWDLPLQPGGRRKQPIVRCVKTIRQTVLNVLDPGLVLNGLPTIPGLCDCIIRTHISHIKQEAVSNGALRTSAY